MKDKNVEIRELGITNKSPRSLIVLEGIIFMKNTSVLSSKGNLDKSRVEIFEEIADNRNIIPVSEVMQALSFHRREKLKKWIRNYDGKIDAYILQNEVHISRS